jgi:hypothetical protein
MGEVNSTDFESHTRRIFNSCSREPERKRRDQEYWWNNFYCHRADEYRKFIREFIDDGTKAVCCLTGQPGAGKSTFASALLEHPEYRIADGIFFNIATHANSLHMIQNEVTGRSKDVERALNRKINDKLNRLIAKEISLRFRHQFEWIQKGLAQEFFCTDVSLNLGIRCTEQNKTQLALNAAAVDRDVMAALVLVSADRHSVKLKETIFSATKLNEKSKYFELFGAIRDHLSRKAIDLSIPYYDEGYPDSAVLLSRWIRAYADFFAKKKMLLVIDNIDWVFSPFLHRVLADYARLLSGTLFRNKLAGDPVSSDEDMPLREVKVVYAIRNSNLRPSIAYRWGYNKEVHFSLNVEEHVVNNTKKRIFTPLNYALLQNVVDKRIGALRDKCAECMRTNGLTPRPGGNMPMTLTVLTSDASDEGIADPTPVCRASDTVIRGEARPSRYETITSIRNCQTKGELLQEICQYILNRNNYSGIGASKDEKFYLEDITNGSISGALVLCNDIALRILRSGTNSRCSIQEFLANYKFALRTSSINWLFNSDLSGGALFNFINEAKLLVENPDNTYYCCAHRLILTYLLNLSLDSTPTITVDALVSHLNTYALLDRKRALEALHFLFQPGEVEGEFITIYQDEPVTPNADVFRGVEVADGTHESISPKAVVHINPKGRVFIHRIMTRLEYWARLAETADSDRNLYECTPEEALDYLRPIYVAIMRSSTAHRRNWKLLVEHYASLRGLQGDSLPFSVFTEAKLTYRKDRVATTMSAEGRSASAFYLHRVSNSAMHMIIQYFNMLFRGGDARLLLPADRQESFEENWPRPQFEIPQDPIDSSESLLTLVDTYCEQLKQRGKSKEVIVIRAIFEIVENLDHERIQWDKLKGLTLDQIRRLPVE